MKILVDMNLSPVWADFLIDNGMEATHWSSIGPPDAPDTEIMTYAKEQGFTVLTNDLDFGFILAITHGKKPSVIQTRTGALCPDRIGEKVIKTINLLTADIDQGALITIDPHKIRVTLLPL
jgi:predicted nuclease of predicted toxin-antitoxin system